MRIAIGGISHESSTFSTVPTTLRHFRERGWFTGDELLRQFTGTKSPLGAYIDAARDMAFEVVPTMTASAVPAGPVNREATETLTGQLANLLREARDSGPLDGVLLALHGAMVSEIDDDGESYILRAVREVVGPDLPVIVELDLHGNISDEMVRLATIAVAYDEYPHTDPYERGYECGLLMARVVRGGVKPTAVIVKIPMITPIQRQHSHTEPMLGVKRMIRELENIRGVLNISCLPGFPYADIPHTNFTVIVTTDNNPQQARDLADQIASHVWSLRDEFTPRPVAVDEAVRRAMTAPEGPIVLSDGSDNPGGGAPADGTVLLAALLRHGATRTALVPMVDPETVQQAIAAGVGETIQARIGAKTDNMHGDPLTVMATVRHITDGHFVHKGPMNTGVAVELGPTAVLEVEGEQGGMVQVVTTSLRYQPTDLEVLRSQGIEPTEQQILAVKSSVHYRAAFTPVAKEIIEVDTPGLTSPHLDQLEFQHLARPVYPFDPETTFP
ncbi:MAG TPA: M81 family metallopeptidase [Thermomicrobiales bacterium]|nr:M81 family metallopeptidase [Thermomicrobiales bacterium]